MKFDHEGHAQRISGYYEEATDTVCVSSGLGKYEAEVIYFHERQHQLCWKSGCRCYKRSNDVMCEYHALKGELLAVLQRGSVRLARAYLKNVRALEEKAKQDSGWADHIKALRRVKRLKAFKRVQALAVNRP